MAAFYYYALLTRRLKLTERVATLIADPREPDKIQHQVVDLLRQRVYRLACGYEVLNDHDTLRNDIASRRRSKRARYWAAVRPCVGFSRLLQSTAGM